MQFKLPDGIDPATPVGQLNAIELRRIAAAVRGYLRWHKVSKKAKREQASRMGKARMQSMTAAERSAVAAKGGLARQRNRREGG